MKASTIRRVLGAAAAGICATFLAASGGARAAALSSQIERIAGADRYATAAEVAERFPPGREVYVASGESFPDSLAAGPAAARAATQAPILLVTRDAIPDVTKNELRRLTPRETVVVGGPAAVSDQVVAELQTFTTGVVQRLAGQDRYGTAIAILDNAFTPGVDVLDITTGRDFPYALLLGLQDAVTDTPLLLIDGRAPLTNEQIHEITRLAPKHINVFGDTSVISDGVGAQIAQLGDTRHVVDGLYDLSAKRWTRQSAIDAWNVVLVTGSNFPDGLAAAGFAGLYPGQLGFVVPSTCVPQAIINEVTRLQPPHITLIGGPAALSTNVENLVPCP